MTKSKPCPALQALIDENRLRIEVDGWVERTPKPVELAKPKSVSFATPISTTVN
jgi:hypothetical protein